MLKKFLFFLKYNNAVILILAVIFVIGTSVFAASDPGQEFIGKKETQISGTDNKLLLEADLDTLDMDYKIEKVEEDDKYYYVIYTYLDLLKKDNAWQYQLNEKIRKISKNIKTDLGIFLAQELKEDYEAKIADLKLAKAKAQTEGESVRQEVSAYTGLIGKTLEITAKVFDGYEPVIINEVPSPTIPPTILAENVEGEEGTEKVSPADNLTFVVNDYMEKNDPDKDGYVGVLDNCPNVSNINQKDENLNGIGDACEATEEQVASEEKIILEVEPVLDEDQLTPEDNVESDSLEQIDNIDEPISDDDYETVEVVEIQ